MAAARRGRPRGQTQAAGGITGTIAGGTQTSARTGARRRRVGAKASPKRGLTGTVGQRAVGGFSPHLIRDVANMQGLQSGLYSMHDACNFLLWQQGQAARR